MLYNHPSVVVWCMHNEPLYIEDTSKEPVFRLLKTQFSLMVYSWNRDVMDVQLLKSTRHLDATRTLIRSSGELYIPGWHAGTDTRAHRARWRGQTVGAAAGRLDQELLHHRNRLPDHRCRRWNARRHDRDHHRHLVHGYGGRCD